MLQTTIESIAQFTGTISGVGVASVGLASSSASGGLINESTLLPLSLFMGGIIFSVVLTWRTASAKADLHHRLDMIEKRLDNIEDKR